MAATTMGGIRRVRSKCGLTLQGIRIRMLFRRNSLKGQCTARCLQRVAQRKCWLIDNYFKEYKHLKTAEPHVASNVRYISFQRNLQLKNDLSSYPILPIRPSKIRLNISLSSTKSCCNEMLKRRIFCFPPSGVKKQGEKRAADAAPESGRTIPKAPSGGQSQRERGKERKFPCWGRRGGEKTGQNEASKMLNL